MSQNAVQVITAREVPLGGLRAMTVRRTLPSRERAFVGAWCFADHYGPDDVSATGGMDVAPHPHTGLQTVSWLFSGEIEHRDSAGVHALVEAGQMNLMTAGAGICHSEVSTPENDCAARRPALGGAARRCWPTARGASSTTYRTPSGCPPGTARSSCWSSSESWPALARRCGRRPRCSAPS